jgi:chromosome partitioning protein
MSGSMFVIAIVGQKGGTGKTTTGICLAVAASSAGKSAVIIDLDPQANAANWKDRRQAESPAVVSAPPSRLRQTIEAAATHGADFMVIDTPGKLDTAAVDAARVANLVLVPLGPHIFHLETLPGLRDLLRLSGEKPTFVLLNGMHPQATRQADEAKKMIMDTFGFPVCPVHLSRLDVYAETQTIGSTPLEHDPKGKAALEVKRLYKFISQQSTKLDSPHV